MRSGLLMCLLVLGCAAKEDVAAQLVACSVAGNPDAAIAAGTALLRPGRLGGADTATTHQHRGEAFFRRQQFALADADFEAALAANPRYASAWFNRAVAWLQLGDYDKARADLSEVEWLAGLTAAGRYIHGLITRKSRVDTAGRQEMEQALAAAGMDLGAASRQAPGKCRGGRP